jgi:hypothetical protein
MFSMASLRSEGFSWQAALSLAKASDLAYQAGSAITALATGPWGFSSCRIFDAGDTQGFAAFADDVVVLAFRGTESPADWIRNIDTVFQERPYGQVHRGFLTAFDFVRGDLDSALGASVLGGKRLWVTGHSLGGALATVCCAEQISVFNVAGIYTFGQPRVGNSAFHEFYKSRLANRLFRFVNNDDVVTRLPWGYEHCGRLYRFDASGNIRIATPEFGRLGSSEFGKSMNDPPPLTEAEFRALKAELDAIKSGVSAAAPASREAAFNTSAREFFPSLRDHRMEHYIALVERQAQRERLAAAA